MARNHMLFNFQKFNEVINQMLMVMNNFCTLDFMEFMEDIDEIRNEMSECLKSVQFIQQMHLKLISNACDVIDSCSSKQNNLIN